MRKFDLVNSRLTDGEIRELQALCADTVSDILADINNRCTLQAAIKWTSRCARELSKARRTRTDLTFCKDVTFHFNRCKYDKRYDFPEDFYVVRSDRVAQLVLEFDDRWSEYSLLAMANAITDALQQPYESGRKIPQNQWWEHAFDVDRVLWRLTTQMNNILIQRDAPKPASTEYVPNILYPHCIVEYIRILRNACALCTTIEAVYGPDTDFMDLDSRFDDDEKAMMRCGDNLSRLLPGIIENLGFCVYDYERGIQ